MVKGKLGAICFDGRDFFEFEGPRIETRNTHGTGCTFAAALAANLALGQPLPEAAERAKRYVQGALRSGFAIGRGHGVLDHFWNTSVSLGPEPASRR